MPTLEDRARAHSDRLHETAPRGGDERRGRLPFQRDLDRFRDLPGVRLDCHPHGFVGRELDRGGLNGQRHKERDRGRKPEQPPDRKERADASRASPRQVEVGHFSPGSCAAIRKPIHSIIPIQVWHSSSDERQHMKFSSLARKSAVASVLAIGLTVVAVQPSYGWSSSITYQQPYGCVNGSLVGQSWHPSAYESRSTSASAGNCNAYYIINHQLPYLFAALRYVSGGNSAGSGTTTGTYVTTTGWAHYSTYRGGYHRWDTVTLNS